MPKTDNKGGSSKGDDKGGSSRGYGDGGNKKNVHGINTYSCKYRYELGCKNFTFVKNAACTHCLVSIAPLPPLEFLLAFNDVRAGSRTDGKIKSPYTSRQVSCDEARTG